MNRQTALPFVVAALFVTAACNHESRSSLVIPTTPTVSIPRALPGAPPNATPISVGQNVRATVTVSDTPCEFGYGPEPCQQFSIVPSTTGLLWVRLSAAGPSELALKIAGVVRGYGSDRIEGTANVSAGQVYEVSVSLHYAKDGKTSQPFELTTGIEP
jgi:hypothetical protein